MYEVRIYDTRGQQRWITVDTLLPNAGRYYANTRDNDLWVALAEKAYVVASDQGWATIADSNRGRGRATIALTAGGRAGR